MLLNSFNRRDFCSTGLTGLGALMLAGMSNSPYASAASNQDHFFFSFTYGGRLGPKLSF